MGDGQTNHRTVGQVDGALYQSLAKGATTHYDATVVVLNGTGDNLCCRGGIAVNQHDDLSFLEQTTATCRIVRAVYATSFGIDDEAAAIQQLVGDLYSCLQVAAAILLKVEDKGLHALR